MLENLFIGQMLSSFTWHILLMNSWSSFDEILLDILQVHIVRRHAIKPRTPEHGKAAHGTPAQQRNTSE